MSKYATQSPVTVIVPYVMPNFDEDDNDMYLQEKIRKQPHVSVLASTLQQLNSLPKNCRFKNSTEY